jgi:AcrR family transcriptional regulator
MADLLIKGCHEMQTVHAMRDTPRTPPGNGSASGVVPAKLDGRRERSVESRRRILSAMIALLDRGLTVPTAEQIAAEAEVSLRSVFRHFEDMESLQLEIAAEIHNRLGPAVATPYRTTEWPAVLEEVIARRSELFEQVAPYKAAMDIYRHRSHAVAIEHRRLTSIQREIMARVFPKHIVGNFPLFEAFVQMFSIEAWQRLREQQGLSRSEAEGVWRLMANALAQ